MSQSSSVVSMAFQHLGQGKYCAPTPPLARGPLALPESFHQSSFEPLTPNPILGK